MRYNRFAYHLRCLATALAFVGLLAGPSLALDVYLVAKQFTKTINGEVETMWGFAQATLPDFSDAGAPSSPGPRITIPPTDPDLNIFLKNELPLAPTHTGAAMTDVSIVIPGQSAAYSAPLRKEGRAVSFVQPVAPNDSRTYTWTGLKPGTYIYHSGTHPQVQVQMGLYGAVTKDAAVNEAYSGALYDTEVVLFYSEVDPDLHEAVATGRYGMAVIPPLPEPQDPALYPTSTFHYNPKYFLVNGAPYVEGTTPTFPAGSAGAGPRVLVRMLNMGLRELVPAVNGIYWQLVAEDGNAYTYPKTRYSALLGPGKTKDAILAPTVPGIYPVFERRLNVVNIDDTTNPAAITASTGGMLVKLEVAP